VQVRRQGELFWERQVKLKAKRRRAPDGLSDAALESLLRGQVAAAAFVAAAAAGCLLVTRAATAAAAMHEFK